jgi:hypothetical protein
MRPLGAVRSARKHSSPFRAEVTTAIVQLIDRQKASRYVPLLEACCLGGFGVWPACPATSELALHQPNRRLIQIRNDAIYVSAEPNKRFACPLLLSKRQSRIQFRAKLWHDFSEREIPAVAPMLDYANGQYSEGVYETYTTARNMKASTAAKRLDKIDTLARGRRLLDVGCANGFFMEAALDHGYDVKGVEFSPAAIAALRADIKPLIVRGDVNTSATNPWLYYRYRSLRWLLPYGFVTAHSQSISGNSSRSVESGPTKKRGDWVVISRRLPEHRNQRATA